MNKTYVKNVQPLFLPFFKRFVFDFYIEHAYEENSFHKLFLRFRAVRNYNKASVENRQNCLI